MSKAKGPLCKVCGDEASGFHYGVDSCEGCKGFFRRCITQGMTHRCSNEEKCDMTPFTRNSCQYCRLKKCFAVGMSREASRLGRRPKRIKQDQMEPLSPRSAPSIAPYPQLTQLQISKLSMAELQRLLHAIQSGKAPMPAGIADKVKSETTTIPGVTIKEEHGTSPGQPHCSLAESSPSLGSDKGVVTGGGGGAGIPPQPSESPQQANQTPVMTLSQEQHSPIQVGTNPSDVPMMSVVSPSSSLPPSNPTYSIPGSGGGGLSPVATSQSHPQATIQSSTSNILPDQSAIQSVAGRHLGSTQFSAQTSSGDYESGYSSGYGGDTPSHNSSSSQSPISLAAATNQVPSAQPAQFGPMATSSSENCQHFGQVHRYSGGIMAKGMLPAGYQETGFPPKFYGEHSPSSGAVSPPGCNSSNTGELQRMEIDHNNYQLETAHGQPPPTTEGQFLEGAFLVNESTYIKQEQLSPATSNESQQQSHSLPSSPFNSSRQIDHPPIIKNEPSPHSQCEGTPNSRPMMVATDSKQKESTRSSDFPAPDSPRQRSLAPKNSLGVFGSLMEEAQAPLKREKVELLESVMETIIDVHMNTCNYTIPKIQEGMIIFESKRAEMMQKMASMMSSPVNSNPSAMWGQMVDNMVPAITRTVTFSKRLPGFDELSQQDQIKLIKQGSFEVLFIRYTRLFQDDGMFLPSMEYKVPWDIVKRMPMGGFFLEMYKFGDVFNSIALSDAEIALVTATMVMNADRIGLSNSHAVYKLQGLFLQCLFQYMKKMRPDSYFEVFHKTMMLMPDLREINETHAKHLNSMKMSMPDLNMPDLHVEVFNGKLD